MNQVLTLVTIVTSIFIYTILTYFANSTEEFKMRNKKKSKNFSIDSGSFLQYNKYKWTHNISKWTHNMRRLMHNMGKWIHKTNEWM